MKNYLLKRSVIALTLLTSLSVHAQDSYDVAIINGRVMDPETQLDSIKNVGINKGKIVAITESDITGNRTIDAAGHVVAPGFIDGHSHMVDMPIGQKAALRDGVTTFLDLEAGVHPVDVWYKHMEGRSQINYGASASAVGARVAVFEPDYDSKTGGTGVDLFTGKLPGNTYVVKRASLEERQRILDHVEEGLKQGALGIGPPVGYMTAGFSSEEMIEMQKLAAKYGLFMHVHTRFSSQVSPTSGMLALQEAIDPAIAYGGGTIIAHFTAQALGQTQLAMDYVDSLRKKGFPVALEVYPYNYGGAGNGIQADYLKPENYQDNMGRSYEDIIDTVTGKPLNKETYERLIKENPGHPVLFANARQEDVNRALSHPDILVGCDCFPLNDLETGKLVLDWDTPWESMAGHPRTTGTHGIVLRMTREKEIDLTLMQAISKMSYLWAKYLEENGVAQMAHKGRIQVGADADITIFNPETVTDNSSLKKGENALPTTGIPYVLVNGQIVVENSKVLKGVYPGKAVRAAITD